MGFHVSVALDEQSIDSGQSSSDFCPHSLRCYTSRTASAI